MAYSSAVNIEESSCILELASHRILGWNKIRNGAPAEIEGRSPPNGQGPGRVRVWCLD